MPTPQEFYTGSHVRTAFGEKGPFYNKATGHRGQDIAGWPEGTPIPAYRAGVVVADFWSGGLGWIVVIRYSDGKYGGFCHMQYASPLNVGMHVEVGQTIGWVGNTGTLTSGPHLHTTLSSYSADPGSGQVEDPLAYIKFALATIARVSFAAFVARPLPPKAIQRQGDPDMPAAYMRNAVTAKIAYFIGGGVKVFGDLADYNVHRETMIALIERDPTGQGQKQYAAGLITMPPSSDRPENFVNLDERHWDLEVAVRSGYY